MSSEKKLKFFQEILISLYVKDNTLPSMDGPFDECKGAFTLDVKSMFNVNLGGILGGTQLLNG